MKILIVDDESLSISRLERLLKDLNFEDITSFNESHVALQHILKNKYDVV